MCVATLGGIVHAGNVYDLRNVFAVNFFFDGFFFNNDKGGIGVVAVVGFGSLAKLQAITKNVFTRFEKITG